jgi:iron complex transport system permease protein
LSGRLSPWAASGSLLVVAWLISLSIGPIRIPVRAIVEILSRPASADWPAAYATILLDLRLPGAALMALTGLALGASGAAYQALFRNPLADPYLLGVAAGAGLGAVTAMAAGWDRSFLGMAAIPLAAFMAASGTVSLVYMLARVGRSTPVTTLILAGVAVNAFMVSLTTLIMLLSAEELRRAVVWMLGGFAIGGWAPVLAALPYLAVSLPPLALLGRPLNILQFGDDQARQLGLDIERLKLVVVIASSLLAATAVAFSGVIGFVGLVVPHLVRLLWGPDYRRLVPLAALTGAAFLLLADVAARVVLAPRQLPVGIITALLGAPFFLWLLRRARRELGFW